MGLLNVDGCYNSLLALFDKGVEEGFTKPAAWHIVVSAKNGSKALYQFRHCSNDLILKNFLCFLFSSSRLMRLSSNNKTGSTLIEGL